ncbi:ATP-binding cassette domain-containing protein [Phormidium tenue FACHB-886]|nr:ATP-binding cassette domain-containing protein [Phormidium tenue FACHB-886]
MNRSLKLGDYLDSSTSQSSPKPPLALSKLLALSQTDMALALEVSRAFQTVEFQIGDEVLSFESRLSNLTQNSVQSEPNQGQYNPHGDLSSDLYLICQGRVRLLCCRSDQPRETTALLLEANETFGADSLFEAAPLPYRAVAAGTVQVARLPADKVANWLNHSLPLRELLQQQTEQRQRLIFFKTVTALRSLPSLQLKQFVSLLSQQLIPTGANLASMPNCTGHFWLRRGIVGSQQNHLKLPEIGESWGYPAEVPPLWTAQTDLSVYKLSIEDWHSATALIPALATLQEETSTQTSADRPLQPALPTPKETVSSKSSNLKSSRLGYALLSTPKAAQPQPAADPVVFPKPLNRHLLDFLERYPWIEQQSSSDCGAACLGMICRYWGKQFPLYALREQANVGRSGASLKSLASAAETLGLSARPVRASLNRLAEQKNPWIAHWESDHYVVVYQVTAKRVILADPARGRRSLSREEFQHHWTGYALLIDPTERLQNTEIKQASLTRYLAALLPYRGLAVQVILVSLLIQVFGLVTPLFTQIILDQIVVQKSLSTLNVFALGLLLFSVWGICMGSVRQYLLSYFSNRLDLTLISGFIRHTLTLPLRFFESRRVGDILTRVQENQKIQRFLIGQVVLAWLNFLTGFIYLGLMLYYNWRLTLLVLALIPPIVILTLAATPLLRKVSREIFNEAADQNSLLVEMMTGVETVKSAATERELRWRWEDHLTRQMNVQFKGQKLGIGLQTASGLINSLGSTALLWYGATLVIQDQLTIGQFVAFNMMMGYVISPVIALVNLWDELQEVLISVERLNDVFEAVPEEPVQRSLLILPSLGGAVRFEDVTFRYSEDEAQNTLQNVSFEVRPGQTVAIVGRSGSGKSTLIKLLQGLYHPNRGHVLVDGHDLRCAQLQSLRSQLGVVPQECFLFSGTVLENITLYRAEFSLKEVVEAAKLAEAHAFIQALPMGYNTKVGERGSALSGGQRQRIAIARALLGNPQILILDEATSSLDTESERRFQRNLTQIRHDRTTLVIAHRLSTVRNADNILVLDRGVLVEQGTHEDLMKIQGLYCRLAQQQLDL